LSYPVVGILKYQQIVAFVESGEHEEVDFEDSRPGSAGQPCDTVSSQNSDQAQ
jgi:hypothetical protein